MPNISEHQGAGEANGRTEQKRGYAPLRGHPPLFGPGDPLSRAR